MTRCVVVNFSTLVFKINCLLFVGEHGAGKTEAAKQIAVDQNMPVYVCDMRDYADVFEPEFCFKFAGNEPAVVVLEDFDLASKAVQYQIASALCIDGYVRDEFNETPKHTFILTTKVAGKRLAMLKGSIISSSEETLRGVTESVLAGEGLDKALLSGISEIRIFTSNEGAK